MQKLRGMTGYGVMVTGAGSGIGAATARLLSANGAQLLLVDRDEETVSSISNELNSKNPDVSWAVADVRDEQSVEDACQTAIDRYGALSAAVNCAGVVGPEEDITNATKDTYETVFGVNVAGVIHCMKHQVRHMHRAGRGSIVNVASDVGIKGYAKRPIYAASKHAVVGLTKSAALAYASEDIRINAVCPGSTKTPMSTIVNRGLEDEIRAQELNIPMQRRGEPNEIAAAIAWLVGDDASFVTGAILPVDGGGSAK